MKVRVTSVVATDAATVVSVLIVACPSSKDAIDIGAASGGSTDIVDTSIDVDDALTVTLMFSTGSGRVASAADTAAAAAGGDRSSLFFFHDIRPTSCQRAKVLVSVSELTLSLIHI